MPRGQTVRAPEFPAGLPWLNTAEPLSLERLRGHVVLLDFWTYCCINCLHVLPELKALERKYAAEPFVVIGVHAAKFTNEKDPDNIRQAILRYEVTHPVVVDSGFQVWSRYGVRAWPTLALIDAEGYVRAAYSGEGKGSMIDAAVAALLAEARERRVGPTAPVTLCPEAPPAGTVLSFPGKVLVDAPGRRLAIADSNHNRVVITDLDGVILDVAGSGDRGRADGGFDTATFNHPQGMAARDDTLYVADTENHSIRALDLATRTVTTVAGTGTLGHGARRGAASAVALNSPWDLCCVREHLFIAMAGPHQIWILDLERGDIGPWAGTGAEARLDGPRAHAAFAQPSGITSDGRALYIADSEISSIRAIDLQSGVVRTLAGGDLFDFGDVDAAGEAARLQHPLGVACDGERVYIADTYNHKIKVLDLRRGETRTWLGNGRRGRGDGRAPTFYEPGGVSAGCGELFIADTNNHRICAADLRSGAVRSLAVREAIDASALGWPPARVVRLPRQRLAPGGPIAVEVDLHPPPGFHPAPDAPAAAFATVNPGTPTPVSVAFPAGPLRFELDDPGRAGTQLIAAGVSMQYCNEATACLPAAVVWMVPVVFENGGARSLRLAATVDPDPRVTGAPFTA